MDPLDSGEDLAFQGIPMVHCRILVLLGAAAFLGFTTDASPGPRTKPLVTSPEILPDRRVVFRVEAPRAADVGLWGDWMPTNAPMPMVRDDQGVWSLTQGPLEPGPAIYTVTVDGVTTPDPVNPQVKLRARTSASLVDIPGDPSDWWQIRNVPHGTVAIHWILSEVLGETRAYRVYIPPGYDTDSTRRFPVVCLLHGSNDTAAGWTDVGRAQVILDNLIAAHRAVPMILVMPWGHAVPFDGPQDRNSELFEQHLLNEVLPEVDHRYRTFPGRNHRAIVGLSMGGGQALQIGLGHLDNFSAIAAFSTAVPADFSSRFQSILSDPAGTNQKLRLLWVGCGRQDAAFPRNQQLVELLSAHQIRVSFRESDGLHNFSLWRRHLVEVAPLLFSGE